MNHSPPPGQYILLIEDDEQLGASAADFLISWGSHPVRLTRPGDTQLRLALLTETTVDAVAIVSRDDIVALRYALLVEHLRPGIRLVVSIFDRTTAGEIARSVPNCTVLSITDAIVPNLLAACLDDRHASILRAGDQLLAATTDGTVTPLVAAGDRPARLRLRGRYRTLDTSARALLLSSAGLAAALACDAVLGVLALHERWYDAIWHATRALTTIGSSAAAEHGPPWYKLASAAIMLVVLAMAGLFTASLVDRVTGSRLTGIFGARSIPVRDHVIVVGLGQVGLRLCLELRQLGVPVVAIERDRDARCLPLARQQRIPVILGRGGDRFLLRRAGIATARAIAAVSSNGLENISVAVTARASAPDQQIVLRTDGARDLTDESRSLFRIGAVCDVPRITGALVACHSTGRAARHVFSGPGTTTYALFDPTDVLDLARWDLPVEGQDPGRATGHIAS